MSLLDMHPPTRIPVGTTVRKLGMQERESRYCRALLTADQVRHIRRVSAMVSRWVAWLDERYSVTRARSGECSWRDYRRKSALRRKLLDRYGKAALADRYGVALRTIYDALKRRTYRWVK